MGEMTTLGKAVADISIPTWKELKPASETARQERCPTQHNDEEEDDDENNTKREGKGGGGEERAH